MIIILKILKIERKMSLFSGDACELFRDEVVLRKKVGM